MRDTENTVSIGIGLPRYEEHRFLDRATRFAKLVELRAPAVILRSEMRLINQSMLAAIAANDCAIGSEEHVCSTWAQQ